MKKKDVGQITVKKVGEKFAVCISGTPQELKNSFELAKKIANELREKHGRRVYEKVKKKKRKHRK